MFSVPQHIQPVFNFTQIHPPLPPHSLGAAVKDHPNGALTAKRQEVDQAIATVKEKHQAEGAKASELYQAKNSQYNRDLSSAERKARAAEGQIDQVKIKKAVAITLLVLNSIAAVGLLIASAATGTLPLLLIAG